MNFPNVISLARLLSVPIIVWLIMIDELRPAFVLFLCAGISDALDGFIAKRFNQTSDLGRYLDPLADKALLVGVYITLGVQGYLPVWLVILVAFRDLLIIGGALLLQVVRHVATMSPLMISKANTAAQLTLATVVLARFGFALPVAGLTELLVYVVGATTVLSGAFYLVEWGRRVSSMEDAG